MTRTSAVTTPSDRAVALSYSFNAPRALVFDALTKPDLVKRWLLGPPGWTMPLCEIDLRVGGTYRHLWRHVEDGRELGVSGTYREIARPDRLVHTEKFDVAWYPGEAAITTILTEQAGRTTLTATILYELREARDCVLKSGMEQGVAASYQRLEEVLAASA